MTEVFYCGATTFKPYCKPEDKISDSIEKVCFDPTVLVDIFSEVEKENPEVQTYIEMISLIEPDKLQFIQVNSGGGTTYLLDAKDELWNFGHGISGQIGSGNIKFNMDRPFNLTRYLSRYFINVAVGNTHVMAISNKFKLFMWGDTQFGALGELKEEKIQSQPVKLKKQLYESHFDLDDPKNKLMKFSHACCNENFSLTVVNNKLFSFGKENRGRLGLGQQNISHTEKPYLIQFPKQDIVIRGIACGFTHCLSWDAEGVIYSWGCGRQGKLGHGSVSGQYNYSVVEPKPIKALEQIKVVTASCGKNHSCCITYQGEIFTWGRSLFDKQYKAKDLPLEYVRPKKLNSFFKSKTSQITSASYFTKISSYGLQNAAIDINGFLYTWGDNSYHCLGHQNSRFYNNPVCVEELTEKKVIDVACGNNYIVTIACKKSDKQQYKQLKEVNEKICNNAQLQASKIKQYTELKMKKEKHQQSQSHNQSQQTIPNSSQIQIQISQKMSLLQPPSNKDNFNKPVNKNKSQIKIPKLQLQKSAQKDQKLQKSLRESKLSNSVMDTKIKQHYIKQMEIQGIKEYPEVVLKKQQQNNTSRTKSKSKVQIERPKTALYTKGYLERQTQAPFFQYDGNSIIIDQVADQIQKSNVNESFDLVTKKNESLDESALNILNELDQKKEKNLNQNSQQKQLLTQQEQRRKKIVKGVYTEEVFEKEIQEIYKEYLDNKTGKNDQNRMLQSIRNHYDPFLKNRQQTNSSIRQKFYDSTNELQTSRIMQTTINTGRFPQDEDMQGLTNRSKTSQNVSRFFQSTYRSIQDNQQKESSRIKLADQQMSQIMKTLPQGIGPTEDFLKSTKYQFDDTGIVKRLEQIQENSAYRNYKINRALVQKQKIELNKQQEIERKRQEIYLKSDEYQAILQQHYKTQRNSDSQRLNWMIFLNTNNFLSIVHFIKKYGRDQMKQQLKETIAIKKLQRKYREHLAQMKIKVMPLQHKNLLVFMIHNWQMRKRIERKKILAHKIVVNIQVLKLKRKIYNGVYRFRNIVIHTQHFMRWALQSLKHQRKLVNVMWDNHMINICQSNNADLKQLQGYIDNIMAITKKFQGGKGTVGNSLNHHFQGFDKFVAQKSSEKFLKKQVLISQQDKNTDEKDLLKMIELKAQNNIKMGVLIDNLKMVSASQNIQEGDDKLQFNNEMTESSKKKIVYTKQLDKIIETDEFEKRQSKIEISQNQKKYKQNNNNQADKSQSEDDINPEIENLNLQKMKSKKKRRGCVIQQQEEEIKNIDIENSLFPYTQHSEYLHLPVALRYKNDKITKNKNSLQIAFEVELQVKKQMIEQILRNSRLKYQQEMEKYHVNQEEFMIKNKTKINEKRAELMISIPFQTLKDILQKEEMEQKAKPNCEKDHLPFYDMRQKIAESLPGALKKPQFSIVLTFDEFKKVYLPEYLRNFQREIHICDQHGLFNVRSKKAQESSTQDQKQKSQIRITKKKTNQN